MRATRLKLANVRAIKAAEFRFLPGINLVVGVNGAGKTTVLDALAGCFAEFVFDNAKLPPHPTLLAQPGDVRAGAKALDVECEFEFGGATFVYSHQKSLSGAPYDSDSLHLGGPPPDFGDKSVVWDLVLDWWHRERRRAQGRVSRERIERERDRWSGGSGDLPPYCQVAIWLLTQRLERRMRSRGGASGSGTSASPRRT